MGEGGEIGLLILSTSVVVMALRKVVRLLISFATEARTPVRSNSDKVDKKDAEIINLWVFCWFSMVFSVTLPSVDVESCFCVCVAKNPSTHALNERRRSITMNGEDARDETRLARVFNTCTAELKAEISGLSAFVAVAEDEGVERVVWRYEINDMMFWRVAGLRAR